MQVRLATFQQYFTAFPIARAVYSGPDFTSVNAVRAKAVRFFIGYDSDDTPRLGIILGLREDGTWHCPFSAPFGEIAYNKPESLETIYDFISELAHTLEGNPIHITLAPIFYDPLMLTRLHGVLANYSQSAYWDYNYHYPLSQTPDFEKHLHRSARNKLHQAQKAGFEFQQTADIARAYAVIAANRQSRGYPLAMSLEQVEKTVKPEGPVEADFFLLTLGDADVAAAMVYHAAPGIAQVIYWGDAPGYSHLRPMNIFPQRIFEHYHALGYEIVDIGPSSSHGIPNQGLCVYKENLGCVLTLKPTFKI